MRQARWFAIALVMVLVACGDDDDDVTVDASVVVDASSMTADGSGPGKLTIHANNVTGGLGKALLVLVGNNQGAICQAITADPQSVTAVAKVPAMGNPCDLGAEVTFPAGTYQVSGGLYTPGMQIPERCANTTVTIAGDTSVTLPAFGTCN